MVKTTEVIQITLKEAQKEDEDAIFEFLLRYFFPDEPLNSALERSPTKEDFRPLHYIHSGYSLKAVVNGENGEERMVGVVINKVLRRGEEPPPPPPPGSSTKKIFDILDKLDNQINIWNIVKSNEVFYTVILSVSSECRGLNVGRKLMEESLKKAIAGGFTHAAVDCSSYYSGRAAQQLGYERLCEVRYEDYVNEHGEVIFKVEKPHEAIAKYIKIL